MKNSNKKDYVARLNMADVVKEHQVFDVFVRVAKLYPNQASALFDKYVDFILNNNQGVLGAAVDKKQAVAERIANENIGYFIGNCEKFDERKFLFQIYPTTYHPVLGREF